MSFLITILNVQICEIMKKIILTLCSSLLMVALGWGQSGFGVFGGLGAVTTSNGFLETVSAPGVGIHLGGFYNLEINDNFSFRPKLMYSQQGDRTENNSGPLTTSGESAYKIDYISIPLEAKFFSKPFITVGPQIGFLINSSVENIVLQELEDGFDIGVRLGIGYDINNIFIELSAYQGIQPTLEVLIVDDFTNKITNTTLQLSVGYQFN